MPLPVTEDTPPDMLAGAMDIRVLLPNGRTVAMSVERSTPMMDLLVAVTTAHKLSPAAHAMCAMPENGSAQPLHHLPSTPVGALDTRLVHLTARNNAANAKRAPQRPAGAQPFQTTFRLQVHLPRNQLFVTRVSPETKLGDILKLACAEKNLDPSKYEMRHPGNLQEKLSLSHSLAQHRLQEVTMVASRPPGALITPADIMALHREEGVRRQQVKATGNTAYASSAFNKQRSVHQSTGSVSSDSLNGRSISPAPSDESRSVSPPAPAPPTRPGRKRRPAPKPPGPPPGGNANNDARTHTSTKDDVTVFHSRTSSDSSGYHEASVLSESTDRNGDSSTDTLPRRSKLPASTSTASKSKAATLQHGAAAPGVTTHPSLSRSLSNLTAPSVPVGLGHSMHSASTTSLASQGQRKKKAAPPPPSAPSRRPVQLPPSVQAIAEMNAVEESQLEAQPSPPTQPQAPQPSRKGPPTVVDIHADSTVVAPRPSPPTVVAVNRGEPVERQASPPPTVVAVTKQEPRKTSPPSVVAIHTDDAVVESSGAATPTVVAVQQPTLDVKRKASAPTVVSIHAEDAVQTVAPRKVVDAVFHRVEATVHADAGERRCSPDSLDANPVAPSLAVTAASPPQRPDADESGEFGEPEWEIASTPSLEDSLLAPELSSDWEYTLPAPPSAFRDLSSSPSTTEFGTMVLADAQVFRDVDEPDRLASPNALDSLQAVSTPLPKADSLQAVSTPLPKADSLQSVSTPLPKADSLQAVTTSLPKVNSLQAVSTPLPKVNSLQTATTLPPKADSLQTATLPKADSIQSITTLPPKVSSVQTVTTPLPIAVVAKRPEPSDDSWAPQQVSTGADVRTRADARQVSAATLPTPARFAPDERELIARSKTLTTPRSSQPVDLSSSNLLKNFTISAYEKPRLVDSIFNEQTLFKKPLPPPDKPLARTNSTVVGGETLRPVVGVKRATSFLSLARPYARPTPFQSIVRTKSIGSLVLAEEAETNELRKASSELDVSRVTGEDAPLQSVQVLRSILGRTNSVLGGSGLERRDDQDEGVDAADRLTDQTPTPEPKAPTQSYQLPTPVQQPPTQVYQPPTQVSQPPTQVYQPPTQVYQPPTQVYQPPTPAQLQTPKETLPAPSPQGGTFVYRGPPAINFGSWSERPKVQVSLKSDKDYRIGGPVQGAPGPKPGVFRRVVEQQVLHRAEPATEHKFEPKVQAKFEAKVEPQVQAKFEPKVEAKIEPKPLSMRIVSQRYTPSEPTSRSSHDDADDVQVEASKDDSVSRLPIVRAVELKKSATAPEHLVQLRNTSSTRLNGNPVNAFHASAVHRHSLVDAYANGGGGGGLAKSAAANQGETVQKRYTSVVGVNGGGVGVRPVSIAGYPSAKPMPTVKGFRTESVVTPIISTPIVANPSKTTNGPMVATPSVQPLKTTNGPMVATPSVQPLKTTNGPMVVTPSVQPLKTTNGSIVATPNVQPLKTINGAEHNVRMTASWATRGGKTVNPALPTEPPATVIKFKKPVQRPLATQFTNPRDALMDAIKKFGGQDAIKAKGGASG